MMRGLGETLPANVTVFESSPVNEVHGEGEFRLICPDGEVACRELLLTNHVFAEELGFRRRRVVPIALFASLTRPLEPEQRRRFDDRPVRPAAGEPQRQHRAPDPGRAHHDA